MKTYEELLDSFLYFEYKYDLFKVFNENNIKSWHYIRFWVYMELMEEVFGAVNLNNSLAKIEKKEKSFWIKLDEYTRKSPLFTSKKDILIFNHPRRIKYNNFYKCVYSDEWLKSCDHSYYVFEEAYKGTHFKPVKTKNLKYFDINEYGKLLNIKKEKYISTVNMNKIQNVLKSLETEFNITLKEAAKKNIIGIYINNLMYREYYLKCYTHLLKKIQPKILVVTVAYNYQHMLLIEAAQNMNIKTVELEHGFIATGHIAYNFYEKMNLPAFPDYIFTFGEFDREVPRYPFDKKYAIPVGSAENELISKYYKEKLKNKKKKKVITYLSDGTYDLVRNAFELSNSDIGDYKIRLKLHPSEYGRWRRLYPFLINSNVQIYDDTKHNIYYYLATSSYVIGIASTTVYEATMFDTTILILKEGAYFRSLPLVENKDALLVTDINDIVQILKNNLHLDRIEKKNIYFSEDSITNINKNLHNLLK